MGIDYYVNAVTGDDVANSGLTEGLPFQTIQKGIDTASGYDRVYVKASDIYTEEVVLVNAGITGSGWCIELIGYSSTPGDNGMVTIDGENTRNHAIGSPTNKVGTCIRNFRATKCVDTGIDLLESVLSRCDNCQADNNGGLGIDIDDYSRVIGCYAYNNNDIGLKVQEASTAYGCVSVNNTYGFRVESGDCLNCVAIKNTIGGIQMGNKGGICIIGNCTIDGIDKTTDWGMYLIGGQTNKYYRIFNNIITNCVTGINMITARSPETHMISLCNLIYNNTLDYSALFDGTEFGEVSGNPQLVNASGLDVTPEITSPAVNAGFGPKFFSWSDGMFTGDNVDIGAIQAYREPVSSFAANMCSLFVTGPPVPEPPCELYFDVAITPLFIQGPPTSGTSGIIYIDRTIHEFTYYPDSSFAVIGEFPTGENVTIQVWSSGSNVDLTSSGCVEVDSTGKYIWLLNNFPYIPAGNVQYQWRMSGTLDTVNGDFILYTIEGKDGGMPSINDSSSYIIST